MEERPGYDEYEASPTGRRPRRGGVRSLLTPDKLPLTVGLLDLAMIVLATLAAVQFRQALPFFSSAGDLVENSLPASVILIVVWLGVLIVCGAYDKDIFGAATEEFRRVVNASLVTAGLIGVGAFLFKYPLSRGFFALLFLIGVPLLLLGRLAARRALHRLRRRGYLRQRVLLVGSPGHISDIKAVLDRERWLGYDVIGAAIPLHLGGLRHTSTGISILGHTKEIRRLVDDHAADVVFFAGGAVDSSTELRRMAWDLEDHAHVQIIVAPNLTDVSAERVRIRPVAGLPLMHLGRPRSKAAASGAKRVFDLIGASTVLLLASPALVALIIWIKMTDGGPALFRQTRVGRDGVLFSCFKLRSMVVDADLIRPENPDDHVLFKLEDDPRITRPGRLVRRLSLDELPQLWNVIRGEMSLVGPRPPLPDEVARYEDDMLRRLSVLPGMTGLWQVSGRSDLSWEDTVRLDLYYVDNWSMVQDLSILARTVGAVVAGRGAY